jgi:hypothetical protein
MSKIMTWCMGLALVGALAGCGQSVAVRTAGSWGRAIEVPGLGALNQAHDADLASVSCASAGNCAGRVVSPGAHVKVASGPEPVVGLNRHTGRAQRLGARNAPAMRLFHSVTGAGTSGCARAGMSRAVSACSCGMCRRNR